MNTLTAEQKLSLAEKAIHTTLVRIKTTPALAHLIGAGTETFNQLTAAFAALSNGDQARVMETVISGSSGLPHATPEQLLEAV